MDITIDPISVQSILNSSEEINVGEVDTSTVVDTSNTMTIVYLAIGIVGLVGNFLVMVVLISDQKLRKKPINMYIINQSCIDFVNSCITLAMNNATGEVPYEGLAGDLYCKLWVSKAFVWGFLTSSTYNLLFMTAERYMELVHPLKHMATFSRKKALLSLLLAWPMGPLIHVPCAMVSTYVADGMCFSYANWASETARLVQGMSIFFLLYFIPFLLLIYFYAFIAITLHRKISEDMGGDNQKREDMLARGRSNIIKTLLLVGTFFILCWSPNQIYYFLFNVGYKVSFNSDFFNFTVVAVFFNSCINPFIYTIQYEQFQMSAKALFFPCLPNSSGNTERISNASQRN